MATSKTGARPATRDSHTVDPADEPSADWGWHGTFPKTTRVMWWIIAAFLLLLIIGNHEDTLADLWMVVLAACVVGFLLVDAVRGRNR